MSSIEELWERHMEWYSSLEKRDDGEDDEESDDEEEDKSSTSSLQTRTSTSSSLASITSVASTISQTKTSISSTAFTPSTSSTMPSMSLPTLSTSITSTTVKTTLLTSVITTPASLPATQKGKGNPSTTSSAAKVSSTSATAAQEISSPTKSGTSSKTTINIAIGVTVIALLLIALLVFIFRRKIFRKNKNSESNVTGSIWGGRSSIAETAPSAPQVIYIPPITMRHNKPLVSPLAMNPNIRGESMLSRDGVVRQQRLARVRTDLLRKKELKTGLATTPVQQADGEVIRVARGSNVIDEKYRVDIEASAGMWEDPITIVRRRSVGESEASLPRWRTPVSWVRDQRMRGWGILSG